ncbi:PAS fold-containing protein [Polaribacter sp. KT25b]|uniref:LuxR C-terminal-related transcriptional regulator n=1 Tax=Polaribacter sp. KT25b TaxID=1855336 RepID=UPI00087B31BF|nr:LuxR C-terminal-related transcriptional regulator [Polaribacter sp. KT25b]SDR90506.1 PAS fold-containing protein [Polaribacter sp. KT25b]
MKKNNLDLFTEIFDTHKEYCGTVVETHVQKLKELDAYLPRMQSFFIVTNTSTKMYPFVSKNFEYTLGLDRKKMAKLGATYWFSHFHPDDLPIWMRVLEDLMLFTMTEISKKDRPKLCYSWNFRIKNKNGEYLNTFEHLTPVFFDDSGKPIIGVAHLCIVGGGEQRPIIATVKKLNDKNEYETLFYKNYSQKLLSVSLTNREKDVVRLLALNKTSAEIAKKLFISTHTVNVHRKNILGKLNFDSTIQLVQYCLVNQLF